MEGGEETAGRIVFRKESTGEKNYHYCGLIKDREIEPADMSRTEVAPPYPGFPGRATLFLQTATTESSLEKALGSYRSACQSFSQREPSMRYLNR